MLNSEIGQARSKSITSLKDQPYQNLDAVPRSAVFTKTVIVNFILDLAGYTSNKALYDLKVMEPSFGAGNFLIEIVSRLLNSCRGQAHSKTLINKLADAVRAVELDSSLVCVTKARLLNLLLQHGFSQKSSEVLIDRWIIHGNFLLVPIETTFDFVLGNPPYVRHESISESEMLEYRRRFKTIYDRADLYIPFLERSLSLLNDDGKLGTICADRWMKNKYGGPIRSLISEEYHLEMYIDMTEVNAFEVEVSAYPAITVIGRSKGRKTRIAHNPEISEVSLKELTKAFHSKSKLRDTSPVIEMMNITNGTEPWLLGASEESAIVRRLESAFPAIEEVGCKIGIGVATGADKVFIIDNDSLDIEESRKIPLVTTRDIATGEVVWGGRVVINPYSDDGGLVELDDYPRLKKYFELHKDVIAARHCVRNTDHRWFRTIDRITPSLASREKLLIPDIRGGAHVVFESGNYYPHHNLYFVVSSEWNLRALQAVLLSSVTRLFVSSYSTKMRGGYFRYQAQYLRRLRLPKWSDVSDELRIELQLAAKSREVHLCDLAAFKLYSLSENEIAAIGGTGE